MAAVQGAGVKMLLANYESRGQPNGENFDGLRVWKVAL